MVLPRATAAEEQTGRRFVRKVRDGSGTWHSDATERPVLDALNRGWVVGRRQPFAFTTTEGRKVRTGWRMVELRAGAKDEEDGRRC